MTNRTKLTPENKEEFVRLLEKHGSVTHVCDMMGISRTCAYAHRREDEPFKVAWDAAYDLGGFALLDEAHKRAIGGSDTLMIFLLKGHFPEKFRERRETLGTMQHTGPGGGPIQARASITVQIGDEVVEKHEGEDAE